MFKEQNIDDKDYDRIWLQTPPLNVHETKEIELHDGYFTCEGKILPFPDECLMDIRNGCIMNNNYADDRRKPDMGIDFSLKSPQDFANMETGIYKIGLINNSGKKPLREG